MLFLRQQQQQQQQKAPVLSLLLFYLLALCVVDHGVIVQAEEVNFVVLLPPTTSSDSSSSTSAGYFPLAAGLESVVRLAVEHLNEDESLLDGDEVTLSLVPSLQATEAASGLCSAIATNTTVAAVSALGTFSASLLGSLSSRYLDLPILSVASSAARQEGSSTSGDGGFLFDMQPDIFPQMRALVRLILDMKTDRDALDGRSETTEKVWLVHTSDIYGSTAAAAFNAATKLISVPLVASSSDQTGSIFDDDSADVERATVEITSTTVVAASSQAVFDSEMATLVEEEASIIVLLAEGYDGAIVRTVLSQARGAGLTEGVQWYLPDAAAMDHIFDRNSTYRDAELAFDMRGMLGVRACTPRTGVGSTEASSLLLEWQRLDPTEYPGAGAEGLTADGLMDPLLAFTYDAIFAAAAAVHEADEELQFQDGRNLSGISVDRCPFPVNGPWDNGTVVRDALVSTSSTLTGATGLLTLSLGAGEEDGDVDGRDVESVTFCAVNLRADATYGGRFQAIRTLDGATLDVEDSEGFKDISATQGDQTFPAGGERYPYDRPLLKGRHLDIVMRRDAPPFVFVDGDGDSNADFTGITPSFIQTLSEMLEFTYTFSATPSGTVTPATIEMVKNGTVDMTGSWITITSDRAEFVAFTYPYFDLSLSFVYKPTLDEDVNLWKAFAPFEPRLWLALLFALLVTVFLLWLFEGAKNDQFSHGNWGKRRRNFTRGLSRSVYVTSSLMMTQLTHKPETLEGYLLTLGWLFSSFVLAASYTAELASYLTATRLESTDLTVNKLKNGEIPHSNVALLQGGNTQFLYERDFMRCSGTECDYRIQPQPCFSAVECLTMVLNGTAMTALADSATAEYELQNDFCGLETLPDALYPQHYGLVLPFDSPLVNEFQRATLSLREDGTMSDITEDFVDTTSACVSVVEDEADASNMTVADVSGVFVVLGMFVVIAMSSWCVRRSPLAKKIKARRRLARAGGAEENVMESFERMSRRQQKTFALEATVKLLQESKMQAVNKLKSSELGGDGSLASTNNPAGFRQEMAEGRPVVNLAGNSVHGSTTSRDSFSFSRRGLRSVMNRLPVGKSRRNNVADHPKAVRPKNHGPRGEGRGGGGGGRGRLGALSRTGRAGSESESRNGLEASTEFMSLGGGGVGGGGGGLGGSAWSSQGSSGAWPSRAPSPPPRPTMTMAATNPSRSETVQSAATRWLKRRNSSNAVVSGTSSAPGAGAGGRGRGGGGGVVSATTSGGGARGLGLGLGVAGGGDSGAASVASSSRDIMAVDTAKTVATVGSGDFEEDSDRGGKVWGRDEVAAAASEAGGGAAAAGVVAVAASAVPRSDAATSNSSAGPGDGPVPFHTLSAASEAASTSAEEVEGEEEEEEEEEEGWGEGGEEGGEGDLALAVASPAVLTALEGGLMAE